jgi:hypothetical protein
VTRLSARPLALAMLMLVSVVAVGGIAEHSRVAAASSTSRFETGAPCRLADVRAGTGFERVDRQIVRLYVTDRCGVPAAATAVALTVTVDNTLTPGPGYVSIWPEGAPMPTASIVNYRSREIRANATIVKVGTGGAVDLFAQNGAPLIVDVTGWFTEAATTSAGRFVPITPARATDTRQPPRAAPMAAGETINVPLPLSVPADAIAVALTVTLTESPGSGFFTVFPAGTQRPTTSTINADGPGQTRAAGAIVAVSAFGLDVFSHSGGHVIVDVTGWFTGSGAPVDDDGLFVAEQAPRRLLDTRGGDPVWAAGGVEIANVGSNAAALALNVTIVNPIRPGFLAAYPARQDRPPTSTVNGGASSDIAAAMAIVPTSQIGVGVYSNAGADLVVDVSGWFVGTPGPAPLQAPANVRPPDCTTSTDPSGLNRFFDNGPALLGADYQRAVALPDGRVLWFFQDVFFRGRNGAATFAHNAGLVQNGTCFTLLQSGNYAAPGEYLFPDRTQRRAHWFWPLSGGMGADGRFHLFVAEMRENGPTYLSFTEPIATWKVAIDLTTMQIVDRRPAANSSAALYGFSVESTNDHSYLFAHCHRQFGWDAFPFVDPPEYVHDWDCADRMTVARVPKGQFDQPPAYWNGSSWEADPAAAVNIVSADRLVTASQMYLLDGKWVAITKVGDWFGTRIEIDVATQPQGPYTTVRTIATPAKCDGCNTYFASLLPYRASDGSLLIGISNNVFGPVDLSRYHPTFFATPPV